MPSDDGKPLRLGLLMAPSAVMTPHATVLALARAAEEHGFDSLWIGEHMVEIDPSASRYPYSEAGRYEAEPGLPSPLITLAGLATVTSRIRLGTAVCLLALRNPVLVAKEVSTLDWMSGGRIDLGAGAGWSSDEYAAVGVPFEGRSGRMLEHVQVLRLLWSGQLVSFEGEHLTLPPCQVLPRPLQSPHPPILLGGNSPAALRRVAEIADGWHGLNLDPEQVAPRVTMLRALLESSGRRPDAVSVTLSVVNRRVEPSDLDRYREVGVDTLVLLAPRGGPEEIAARVARLADRFHAVANQTGV